MHFFRCKIMHDLNSFQLFHLFLLDKKTKNFWSSSWNQKPFPGAICFIFGKGYSTSHFLSLLPLLYLNLISKNMLYLPLLPIFSTPIHIYQPHPQSYLQAHPYPHVPMHILHSTHTTHPPSTSSILKSFHISRQKASK